MYEMAAVALVAALMFFVKVSVQAPGCVWGSGEGYRGDLGAALGGMTCLNWRSVASRDYNVTLYPDSKTGVGDHNFCRNPDSSPRPWCYVSAVAVSAEVRVSNPPTSAPHPSDAWPPKRAPRRPRRADCSLVACATGGGGEVGGEVVKAAPPRSPPPAPPLTASPALLRRDTPTWSVSVAGSPHTDGGGLLSVVPGDPLSPRLPPPGLPPDAQRSSGGGRGQKKDLGIMGQVIGISMMVIILLAGGGISFMYIRKRIKSAHKKLTLKVQEREMRRLHGGPVCFENPACAGGAGGGGVIGINDLGCEPSGSYAAAAAAHRAAPHQARPAHQAAAQAPLPHRDTEWCAPLVAACGEEDV